MLKERKVCERRKLYAESEWVVIGKKKNQQIDSLARWKIARTIPRRPKS